MLVLDDGSQLRRLLRGIGGRSYRPGTLYILVPFIEADTSFWRATIAAARAGVHVCVVTRHPADPGVAKDIQELRGLGGRAVFLRNLHAKAVLWLTASQDGRAAFIGSHNFTLSSELRAIELGLLVSGNGPLENVLYRDLQSFIAGLTDCRHRAPADGARRRKSYAASN